VTYKVSSWTLNFYLLTLLQTHHATGLSAAIDHMMRHVKVDEFRAALRQSMLCADSVDGDDVDSLADLYTSVITSICDRLAPVKTVMCRRRESDVWFDECRAARKKCRCCNRSPVYKKQ